jgi:hypothetical protein
MFMTFFQTMVSNPFISCYHYYFFSMSDLTPIDFYLDVYKGSKKLLHSSSLKMKIKRYDEFKTEWTLLQIKNDSECRKFVPNSWFEENARVSRDYLWLVL